MQRDLEEGRFSVLVTETYRHCTKDERVALEDMDVGESWATHAPNVLVRLMSKHSVVPQLMEAAANDVTAARAAAGQVANSHALLSSGLGSVAAGLGDMLHDLTPHVDAYFSHVQQEL